MPGDPSKGWYSEQNPKKKKNEGCARVIIAPVVLLIAVAVLWLV